jgi:hypothetical protein
MSQIEVANLSYIRSCNGSGSAHPRFGFLRKIDGRVLFQLIKSYVNAMLVRRGYLFCTISGLTAIIVFLTLGIWRLFPIYPDEIFYRALVSRTFFEGFERTYVAPFCGGLGQTVPISYIFYPAATIFAGNSFIEDLSYNRIIAAAVMAFCFLMLWLAVKRLASCNVETDPAASRNLLVTVQMIFCSAVLLCCLGTLPATLVMVRAEAGIFILVACLLLSFAGFKKSLSLSAVVAVSIMLIFSVSVFQHPKTLYFLPAAAVSVFALLWRSSRWACMGALVCLAWAGAAGYQINNLQFLTCSELPAYQDFLQSFNINPSKMLSDPILFVDSVLQNVGPERLFKIAKKTMFLDVYDVNYLPAVSDSIFVSVVNSMIGGCWIILLAVSIGLIIWNIRQIFLHNRLARLDELHSRRTIIDSVGLLTLYAGLAAQILLNKTAWFYDCAYWFCILTFLATPTLFRALRSRLASGNLGIRIVIVGCFSFILLSAALSTALSAGTFYEAFKSGFRGPGISIATMNPTATKLSIERALTQCELLPTAPRLIVDDVTYPFIQRSYKPILVTYAVNQTSRPEAIIRAKALKSSGMVFGCFYAPLFPNLSFQRDGDICCTKFN